MANDTTSIQAPSVTLSKYAESESVDLTLLNGEPTDAINQGQLVYLSGNNAVRKVITGAQYPIGVAQSSNTAGKNLAVQSIFVRDLKCKATGGAIAAGAFVRPNGNLDDDGRPEVVAAVAGNYAQMIVLAGGILNAEIRVGVLRVPFIVPA